MTALLDATDIQMATLADLVESIRIAEATMSSMQAARDGLLAIASRLAIDIAKQGDHPDRGDHSIRTVAAEIGAVQHVSDRTIERRMAAATVLVDDFPTVWAAQSAGRISAAHSRVIVDAASHLSDPDDRAAYASIMLPLAEAESPNRLRALARRVAERFSTRSVTERHRTAREQRRVWVTLDDDGMATLHAHGSAVLIHGMFDRLTQAAHALRQENRRAAREAAADGREFVADERTVDQIRADLLADLLLTGIPAGHDTLDGLLSEIRAHVEVTVPVTTLMGDDRVDDSRSDSDSDSGSGSDANSGSTSESESESGSDASGATARGFRAEPSPPAELDGVIPIDTDTARRLAGRATGWDRVLTHPITGAVLAVDRYRPSEQLRRHLRARDQRCRFPGCGLVSRKCDLDHNHAAASGGATCDTNLADFCRRHHVLKHNSPWHVEQREGGVLVWTSPTGRTYIDNPPPQNTVRFEETPDTVPAPF